MNIFKRCRKIFKTIFRVIGISAVSFIVQDCAYGIPFPEDQTRISGKVIAKETEKPILGIQVSIEETEYWERTDKDGYFILWVPVQEVYKLKIEDVDGPYNDGLFKEQTWTLKQNDTNTNLLIGMEIETE
jgi:hypothetical protein